MQRDRRGGRGKRGGAGWARAVWGVPVLAAVVYLNTLGFGFTLDDVEIVERNPIVTEIAPAGAFHRAEEYHQQYLEKRGQSSCGL